MPYYPWKETIVRKQVFFLLAFGIAALLLSGCAKEVLPFEGQTLTPAKVGEAYETSIATGTPDMYYDLDYDATLPRGLILYDDGVLKGTPEEAGDFSFKAVMIDLDDNEYYADFLFTIAPGELQYAGRDLENGTTGEPYLQELGTATGMDGILYALKEGEALPDGLILSEDGVLSGVPNEAAEGKAITVVASAPGCEPVEAAFVLTIEQGAMMATDLGKIVFEDFELPDATVGEPYSESVRKAYGVPDISYAFRFSSGSGLPAGLKGNKDLGMIEGTPLDSTDGPIKFRVTASADGYEKVTVFVTFSVKDKYEATNRFETEYVNTIPTLTGNGYSDSKTGRGMIQNIPGMSGGHSLGYMNKPTEVKYTIYAKEETDADLVLGLGSEVGDYVYDPSMFAILVNGTELNYGTINVKQIGNNEATYASEPHAVAQKVHLQAGENTIQFQIKESGKATGTFSAVGCLFDYIELNNASCELGWYPRVGNLQ